MAHYIDSKTYWQLVEALLNPVPAPGCDRRDAVIFALGEADVWPDSIRADALLAARRDYTRPLPPFGETWPE
jgi:hypothetical protein